MSAIVCGLLLAESLKFSVADRFPVAVGAKIIFAVQLVDPARLDPQVLLKISKSPGLAPVNPMLLIVIAADPLLVSVTTFCPPLPPTGTETQFKELGETETCAARTPGIASTNPARNCARLLILLDTRVHTDSADVDIVHPPKEPGIELLERSKQKQNYRKFYLPEGGAHGYSEAA